MIKKHLLTKQKGIDSCSLLPQKWLVCLLTLLATFVGSGRMWADDVTLFTTDFSTSDWAGKTFTQGNTTTPDVINGITFYAKSSEATKNFSISDGLLVYPANNMKEGNYYMAIPVTGVNGSITIYMDADNKDTRYSYACVEGTSTSGFAGTPKSADKGNPSVVTISDLTEDKYVIYLGQQGSSYRNVKAITITTPYVSGATDLNPEIMTDKIINADFNGLSVTANGNIGTMGAWTWEKSGGNGPMYPFGQSSSTAFEFWHPTASSLTFNIYQTISDLPVGTYGLKAKANNSFNEEPETTGGHAYLFAQVGDEKGFNATPINYNSKEATERDDYTVIFKVTEEGQPVTIGFKATGVTPMAARWFSGDDFKLEYYGTASTQSVTPELCSVQYVMNGYGEQIAPVYEVTAIPSTLPTPTATGVTFAGWYTDGSMSVPAVAGAGITNNTILYAKWITPITEPTTLTFSDKPSNTINFQYRGTIQKPTAYTKALAEGADIKALKFNSEGSLSFTTKGVFELDLYFEDADEGRKIKIDNTDYTIDSNSHVKVELAEGSHTIVKGGDNQTLLCVLKLTIGAQRESDLTISPASANVEINTNTSPFTISSSSDGLLSITEISNNKISAIIDDNGKLVISSSSATVQNASITITQAETQLYKAGTATVTVNVVKPTLATPTISCTDNAVTITSAVEGATIYYTTDDSDPKTSDTKQVYTGVFLITQSGTVKAYATANDYNDSEIASQDVTYSAIAQYTYAVNAVVDGNIVKTLASGIVKDAAVTVYYPIIFKEGNTYYKKNDSDKTTFAETFTAATSESQADVRNIQYVAAPEIVGYIEGGNGGVISAANNSAYSNGIIGWVAAQNWNCRGADIAKLPAGKYSFVTNIISYPGRGVALRDVTGLNNSQAAPMLSVFYTAGLQNGEFTVTRESSLRVNGGNSGNKSSQSADFDYAYITRQNAIVFTTQPVGDNYGTGSSHELTVAATAYFNGDVAPSYQWYKNTTNSNEDGELIPGATNTTFTVPTAAENQGITYYYCVATYTKGGETITAASNTAEAIVCQHNVSEPVIGNVANTDNFYSSFSKFYSLSDGESREFNFKNFSTTTNQDWRTWFNWVVYAVDSKHHTGDSGITLGSNYHEYAGLRADNYDIIHEETNIPRTVVFASNGSSTEGLGSNFQTDMQKGATVTVKVARKDNTLYFYAKAVADQGDNPSNNTYITTYTKPLAGEVAEPMYLFFTTEKAHLTDFSASATKPIYKVTIDTDIANGSIQIYNAEGMTVPNGTYFSLGDEVRFVATPNADYLPSVWTSTGTQGTIDLVNKAYVINRIDKDTHVSVTFAQNTMSFAKPTDTITLPNSGTTTYTQLVTGAGVQIPTYSVIETSESLQASIVQEVGSADYVLHVTGTGTVTVAASLGGLYTTYTLTVNGVAFAHRYEIYEFADHIFQSINDISIHDETYEIAEAYGKIKDLYDSGTVKIKEGTCEIEGIPELGEYGGALVIKAVSGDAYALYTLTIPYEKYVWNFYQEGDGYSNTNPVSRIKTGPLVNNTNPGAADLVEMAANVTDLTYDSKCTEGTINDLKKKQTWLNMQKSDTEADASHYWNYTFKTCRYNDDRKTINYTNEVLFSYKNAVHGDNARVIENTAGLVFNCDANKFGLNDNHTTVEPYMKDGQVYYNARQIREMDRAVLLQGYSSFTIPHVKAGYYVKLYWYRHSDNAGDQFRVENAKDLDGRNINPNDVLRFTGSAYYRNPALSSYRGCTFLQPQYEGADITVTIANSNWTELYRIEVTDKFETDLKICEEEIAGYRNGSEAWAGTDMWNALDINDPANYNTQTHSHVASMLTSRIQTYAKGHQLIKYAPEIHFSGYPGHCFTWNGWTNTTLQAEVEGSAKCASATNAENNVPNALPIDPIWVGNNIRYTAHHLKDVHGTGTIKLTLRTHSGSAGEPHYTLDKVEATVATGEYSVQDYPYTWDFTKYNLDKTNAYDGKTFEGMATDWINVTGRYGNWANNTSDYAMGAYTTVLNGGNAENPETSDHHKLKQGAERHKPFFAQGAQLNLGDGEGGKPRTILESEGLRINIPAVNADNNNAVRWTEGENGDLTVNGTITIPEVTEGMYVFVRSERKPTMVEGAVDLNDKSHPDNEITSTKVTYLDIDNEAKVALNQKDLPSNVWIYKQVNDANTDVVITPNGAVDGIGVTKYMKAMVQFKNMEKATYTTDARAESVDYHNTDFFTNHDLQAYVANNNANMNSQDASSKDSENGTITLTPISVIPAQGTPLLDGQRGIMLEDVRNFGTSTTPRPLLPLFVPACNLKAESLASNKLIGCINGTENVPASTSTVKTYILTNQYYDWDWAKNQKTADSKNHIMGDAAFYINREKVTARKNSAYLQVSIPSSVKQIYMMVGEDDMDMDEPTAIEGIELNSSDNIISEPVDVYTLTGVKLNGMPTQKGVYVINGKKVLVK